MPQEISDSGNAVTLEDLVDVHMVVFGDLVEKSCGICGVTGRTSWEAKTNKGNTIAICESCVTRFHDLRKKI